MKFDENLSVYSDVFAMEWGRQYAREHDTVRAPLLMNKESRLQKESKKGIAEIF
jgi:hypothetical protein